MKSGGPPYQTPSPRERRISISQSTRPSASSTTDLDAKDGSPARLTPEWEAQGARFDGFQKSASGEQKESGNPDQSACSI